jgi:hypothetical protein
MTGARVRPAAPALEFGDILTLLAAMPNYQQSRLVERLALASWITTGSDAR